MPLGLGYTVEHQVTGEEIFGGVQIIVYNAKKESREQLLAERERKKLEEERREIERRQVWEQQMQQVRARERQQQISLQNQLMRSDSSERMICSPTSSARSTAYNSILSESFGGTSQVPTPQIQEMSYQQGSIVQNTQITPSIAKSGGKAKSRKQNYHESESISSSDAPQNSLLQNERKKLSFNESKQEYESREPQTQAREMGLSAGGRMKQQINKDPYGPSFWDQENTSRIFVHIVNSAMFYQITGRRPPQTPIDARSYSQLGYPWYDMFNEPDAVAPSDTLSNVKSVREIDQERYMTPQQDDSTVPILQDQVRNVDHVSPYQHLVPLLNEMGFMDNEKNIMLLEKYRGNMEQVIHAYFG